MRQRTGIFASLYHALANQSLVASICWRMIVLVVAITIVPDVFFAGTSYHFATGKLILEGQLPYVDFVWEYPPFSVLALFLITVSRENYHLYTALFILMMFLAELGTFLFLRERIVRAEARAFFTTYWTAVLLPFAVLGYHHQDYLSALCGAFVLGGVLQMRAVVAPVFLGFGLKVWPIVTAPILLLQRRYRAIAHLAIVCIVGTMLFAVIAPEGFRSFLEFRKGNGFQIESVVGSLLLATGHKPEFLFGAYTIVSQPWSWLLPVLPITLILFVIGIFWHAWKRNVDAAAFIGLIIVMLLLTSRLLSPQFIVWVFPFAAPLVVRSKAVGWTLASVVMLTLVELTKYELVVFGNTTLVVVLLARNAALICLAVALWRAAFTAKPLYPLPRA